MTVTHERFVQGMTYIAYKEQMTRNRERLEENERTVELVAADLAFFRALPEALNVLVITEDWCGDAIANLPVLARLAEASGKLELRIFLRDQNLDLADQYLKEGKYRSVPTIIFFTADMRQLGVWIERPAKITAQQNTELADLFATAPELQGVDPNSSPAILPEAARNRVMRFYTEFRTRTRADADAEVVREVRTLVEAGLTRQEAGHGA